MDCDRNNYACQGGTMKVAFKFLIANGNVLEANYPYKMAKGTCDTTQPKTAYTLLNNVSVLKSHDSLTAAVEIAPVTVGIQSTDIRQYKGGVVTSCTGTRLDHAVLVVGYEITAGGDTIYKVRNSWGTRWGEIGYFRV